MLCPNCQHPNTATAKFCENCGFKLQPSVISDQSPVISNQLSVISDQSPELARLEKLVPKEFAARLMQSRTGRVEGERRIVTILFCDVKGSTAIGDERDPEEIMEIMNGAFDALIEPVYRYEGTLARLMGDAILAFFGAPIAHEDDPERACLAALAMQEKIAQYARELKRARGIENFAVRVGINTGLVVVGEVGSDLRVEYTAMGDAINLASRMEQSAEPGAIVITENTARLVRHALALEPLGALAVKGKAEPVNAYRVAGEKEMRESTRGIVGLSSPLVGRAQELNLLQKRLNDVLNGRGQIVSVIGEAGLGKSRLIAELRKSPIANRLSPIASDDSVAIRDTPHAIRWLEARSLSYETQTPYAPFVDLFNHLFEIHIGDADADAYEKIKTQLRDLVGEQSDELAPFVATLLGLELSGEDLERVRYLMPPFLRGRITQAVAQILGALAAQQPTVIVFEDLHWADATSLEILGALVPLVENAPLLFLLLMRPNKTDPAWQFLQQITFDVSPLISFGAGSFTFDVSRFTVIELQPLDEGASRELVANLLEIEDLPEKVRALILQKAEGNPFYVEEVIRSLLDQKLVVREGDRWRATREISNIVIPDTLAGVITARLDRLDEEAKHTAQTASVLGREFELMPLAALYESPVALEPSLDTLQARELIRRTERTPLHSAPGVERNSVRSVHEPPLRSYLFKHALTQETAYNSLLLSKRRALHKRAAAFLEQHERDRVNDIARHWLDAQENERALPFVLEAADRAARAYATTEAIAYYTRAQELSKALGDVPAMRRAYEGLGSALSFTVELPRAVQVFQEMYELGKAHGDVLMQISALNKQANLLALRMGQPEQAEPLLLHAEAMAREYQDKVGLGEMYVIRCQISTGMSDFDKAMHYIDDAVQVGKDLDVQEQIAWGLAHLASTYAFMLRFEDATRVAAEALTLAREIDHREFQADILTTTSMLHWRNGDLAAAIADGEQAAETAERIGLAMFVVIGKWAAGWGYWQRGEYSDAFAVLDAARRAAEPYAGFMPFLSVMSEASLGSVMVEAGMEPETAQAYHQHARELATSMVGGMSNGSAYADIGESALWLGDFDLANKMFEDALSFPSFFRLVMRPRNLLGLAELARIRGEYDAAQKYLDEARSTAEENAIRPYQALVALADGKLHAARGNHARALEWFADAETRAAAVQMRPVVLDARIAAAASLDALRRDDEHDARRAQADAMAQEIANLFSDPRARAAYLASISLRMEMQTAV